jgi:hypothetical protein
MTAHDYRVNETIGVLKSTNYRLRQKIAAMKEWLRANGRHAYNCNLTYNGLLPLHMKKECSMPDECTCGLDDFFLKDA